VSDVLGKATCDKASGSWVFPPGDVNISNLYSIDCPIIVNGMQRHVDGFELDLMDGWIGFICYIYLLGTTY
jgi:hypothetical protein